jgi:CRP-like cAMP-binding protein
MPQSFLESLDSEAREQLISVSRPVSFMKGATLVRHGEPARGAYVLREGAAEAVVTLPGGESIVVAKLAAGSIFGEMALIELATCTATVRATANIDGWFVAHEDFRALVSQCQPAAIRLQHEVTAILAARIAALNEQLLARPAQEDRAARPVAHGDPLDGVARSKRAPFDAAAFLPRLPAFERFSGEEIDEVVSLGSYLDLPRGHGVFAAGIPATAMFIVIRGAIEILALRDGRERRIAVLGPGQLVGYLSVLRGAAHSSFGFVREAAVLLEIPADAFREIYFGASRASARLRGAVQASLLGSMARTNRALTRLISQAQLDAAHKAEVQLEAAFHSQLATPS